MASRPNYVNPISMGLLGGVTNWANEMEKYNLLNAQNNARQQAYATKYSAMANVSKLREQNNAMIAKMKVELGQKQYTNVLTDGNGNKVVSMGHMIADPNNPDQFVPHEDTRMSLDEYNKFKGAGRTTGSDMTTVAPGGTVLSKTETNADGTPKVLFTAKDRPNAQADIAARQAANIATRADEQRKTNKDRQDRADQAAKINRVDALTNKDLDKFDNAGTAAQKLQMLKNAGIEVPNKPGMLYGTNPPSAEDVDAMRDKYEEAMRAKHAKNLGVTPKQLEEGPPAAAVDSSAETGDTTSEPDTHVPVIKTGTDGKSYKLPDGIDPDTGQPRVDPATGKVKAVPLAMDTVDTGDAVAQGPDDENEPAPDEEDSGPDIKGLLEQYGKQNDNALAQQQSQMAGDDDSELEPEQDGILAG